MIIFFQIWLISFHYQIRFDSFVTWKISIFNWRFEKEEVPPNNNERELFRLSECWMSENWQLHSFATQNQTKFCLEKKPFFNDACLNYQQSGGFQSLVEPFIGDFSSENGRKSDSISCYIANFIFRKKIYFGSW